MFRETNHRNTNFNAYWFSKYYSVSVGSYIIQEFLIVFIANALFAKCLVFAVQMTYASVTLFGIPCALSKHHVPSKGQLPWFHMLGYYTYVPKG